MRLVIADVYDHQHSCRDDAALGATVELWQLFVKQLQHALQLALLHLGVRQLPITNRAQPAAEERRHAQAPRKGCEQPAH